MKTIHLSFVLLFALIVHARESVSDSLNTVSLPQAEKSEAVAYGLAIGGTLVPIIPLIEAGVRGEKSKSGTNSAPEYILSGVGFTFGPSLGQFYANSMRNGLWDCTIRAVGFGIIWMAEDKYIDGVPYEELLSPITVSLIAGGIIHSFIDTHFAVQRANEKFKTQHFGFSPELFPASNGGLKPGMMAWMSF